MSASTTWIRVAPEITWLLVSTRARGGEDHAGAGALALRRQGVDVDHAGDDLGRHGVGIGVRTGPVRAASSEGCPEGWSKGPPVGWRGRRGRGWTARTGRSCSGCRACGSHPWPRSCPRPRCGCRARHRPRPPGWTPPATGRRARLPRRGAARCAGPRTGPGAAPAGMPGAPGHGGGVVGYPGAVVGGVRGGPATGGVVAVASSPNAMGGSPLADGEDRVKLPCEVAEGLCRTSVTRPRRGAAPHRPRCSSPWTTHRSRPTATASWPASSTPGRWRRSSGAWGGRWWSWASWARRSPRCSSPPVTSTWTRPWRRGSPWRWVRSCPVRGLRHGHQHRPRRRPPGPGRRRRLTVQPVAGQSRAVGWGGSSASTQRTSM